MSKFCTALPVPIVGGLPLLHFKELIPEEPGEKNQGQWILTQKRQQNDRSYSRWFVASTHCPNGNQMGPKQPITHKGLSNHQCSSILKRANVSHARQSHHQKMAHFLLPCGRQILHHLFNHPPLLWKLPPKHLLDDPGLTPFRKVRGKRPFGSLLVLHPNAKHRKESTRLIFNNRRSLMASLLIKKLENRSLSMSITARNRTVPILKDPRSKSIKALRVHRILLAILGFSSPSASPALGVTKVKFVMPWRNCLKVRLGICKELMGLGSLELTQGEFSGSKDEDQSPSMYSQECVMWSSKMKNFMAQKDGKRIRLEATLIYLAPMDTDTGEQIVAGMIGQGMFLMWWIQTQKMRKDQCTPSKAVRSHGWEPSAMNSLVFLVREHAPSEADGRFSGALTVQLTVSNPLEAETLALYHAVLWCVSQNWCQVVFVSDCQSLVKGIQRRAAPNWRLASSFWLLLDAADRLPLADFVWLPRSLNQVAHNVCQWAFNFLFSGVLSAEDLAPLVVM
ncbi:hypothetical protein F8388_003399 [Cannabis sativa]|uniref:RNase H type-1 domain-containing protein n=1 Tax=Cannabis sativa TaxID=3483 RepID=A0A7J6E366_CANSA|nr:hypothetical protein F8388_003399 [Cannabis sativa]KAF4355413.1 hypothetical protein G4B88_009983 [Cannabis sativa]